LTIRPQLKNLIDFEFTDKFLVVHKPRITPKISFEDKPLLTFIEAYRTLGFNLKDENTILVLNRCITREKHGIGHSPFEKPEDIVKYCQRWDLRRDRETVEDLRAILTQVLDSIETVTEGGEELKVEIKRFIESSADGFRKRSADPLLTPSGQWLLQKLWIHTLHSYYKKLPRKLWMWQGYRSRKHHNQAFWERVRGVIQPHRGAVGFDDGIV
jgi:hypothetical protein